jgi:hypothetical protein
MRYFARWRTSVERGELEIDGWDVIDQNDRALKTIATYKDHETAQAIVKLLNTQEEHYADAEATQGKTAKSV